ncbi:hypothetical protein PBI_GAIA_71 [Mycobacterium phage Gaia]|uniref:Uncharacterized protein n=1 Tax=Mycobacterium phage Gaia TaxID=1486472 RepID=A0A068F8Q2_9CAUD|nr:hypothetical protein VC46_gp162 [Mycobacterium phage Gaia]AID58890.1 hypothetical protein PBI_GAIA_71 [Mycobacterium phage Gaia]AYR00010.1 hypothetical protein PBI_NEBKISS_71 [Mycobacterium phage Nebkiss]
MSLFEGAHRLNNVNHEDYCRVEGCDRPRIAKGMCAMHRGRKVRGTYLYGPPRSGPRPYFDWAACGTPAQARKHYRLNIPICEPCKEADNHRRRERSIPGRVSGPWTADEDAQIWDGSVRDVALKLGRSSDAVRKRRALLKQKRGNACLR